MMHCAECQSLLSDFIDGDLSGRVRRAVEEHLGGCRSCDVLREDLARIIEVSATLPLHTPPARVWERIEHEMASARVVPGPRAWWDRLEARRFDFSVSARQLVAAAAVLVVAVGTLWTIRVASPNSLPSVNVNWSSFDTGNEPIRPLQLSTVETEIDMLRASVGEMAGVVAQKRSQWSPELQGTFAKRIAELDARVGECQRAYDADPSAANRAALVTALGDELALLEKFAKI